ncbi:MAG: TMEM175 family protein, partial [Flavobacteriales bacterium]
MGTNRLEAFSDGVMAIIITIMVLELKVPHGSEIADLTPLVPKILGYLLSFVYVGIYWNSHHHMFHVTESVNGAVLWSNLHLLFWLSLIPFVTGWMGENHFTPLPTALYGIVLLMSGIAYTILQSAIIRMQGADSKLAKAVGGDRKGKVSLVLYIIAIACSFILPMLAGAIYAAVALIWFIPDRR